MKKRFYIYNSWEEQMKLLSTEEQATMLLNLFRFQNGEEVVLDTPMLKMCWASMKFLLEKDATTYQQKVDNMKKIGQRNKQSNDTVTTSNDTVRPRLDNDNDNDNANVNENENEKGNEKGNGWIVYTDDEIKQAFG